MRWPWLLLVGCVPELPYDGGLVDTPRVLAIRADPAEARPGTPVRYTALVATPDGEGAEPVEWAYCVTPRRAEERTAVSATCLAGEDLEPIGSDAAILADACTRFGPNSPPVEGDEAPRRPSDPDATGGYYLPVRASTAEASAFGAQRVRCDLAGATRDVFDAWQDRYTDNLNPVIDQLDVPMSVAPGTTVDLGVQSSSAEPYVVYVAERSRLLDRTEDLTAHWFVTGGTLRDGRTPLRDGYASTRWTAPDAGDVHLWVVLLDDRGGVDWVSTTVRISLEDR